MIESHPYLPCRWCGEFGPRCVHVQVTEVAWEQLLQASARSDSRRHLRHIAFEDYLRGRNAA